MLISQGPFSAVLTTESSGHRCLERNSHVALAVGALLFICFRCSSFSATKYGLHQIGEVLPRREGRARISPKIAQKSVLYVGSDPVLVLFDELLILFDVLGVVLNAFLVFLKPLPDRDQSATQGGNRSLVHFDRLEVLLDVPALQDVRHVTGKLCSEELTSKISVGRSIGRCRNV